MYAGGLCVRQDIPRAKEYYAAFYGGNSAAIGKALFYDAVDTTDADERAGLPVRRTEMKNLLAESKRLGFLPEEKDLAELRRRRLDYDTSAINPQK